MLLSTSTVVHLVDRGLQCYRSGVQVPIHPVCHPGSLWEELLISQIHKTSTQEHPILQSLGSIYSCQDLARIVPVLATRCPRCVFWPFWFPLFPVIICTCASFPLNIFKPLVFPQFFALCLNVSTQRCCECLLRQLDALVVLCFLFSIIYFDYLLRLFPAVPTTLWIYLFTWRITFFSWNYFWLCGFIFLPELSFLLY